MLKEGSGVLQSILIGLRSYSSLWHVLNSMKTDILILIPIEMEFMKRYVNVKNWIRNSILTGKLKYQANQL